MRLLFLLGLMCLSVAPLSAQDFGMELLGRLEYDVRLSDVWGYVDEQGNEYALVGMLDNFSVVDVTDPTNPQEVFRTIGGTQSHWRDIKTFGDYAYITCECGPGLLIVDLSPLPESGNLTYTYWVDDSVTFYTAHNLYIDEKGIAYIFGAFYSKGGAIMLDLTQNPMDPEPIGIYDEEYLHDGVVRNDTLWGAAINLGEIQVIDVSDPAEPQRLSSWKTPNTFSHNIWFSENNRYVFTTDEVRGGSIAAYNVTNIFNPTELDRWMVNDTGIIPHNTHWKDGYLITSHYTYGVNVLDVSRPNNIVEVGRYDTSPDYIYEGFHGCWGAYPYLPSGRVLATDIEEGLYIFDVNYRRACYLEGQVRDRHTGKPIFYPEIEILGEGLKEEGDIVGQYAMATLEAGVYDVVFRAEGYFPDTIRNVGLTEAEVTVLDVTLSNWPVGISESTNAEMELSPNPAKEVAVLSGIQPGDEVAVFNVNGQLVFQRKATQSELRIDVSDWPEGIYVLRLNGQESSLGLKLIH